jgi:hypothetical protein
MRAARSKSLIVPDHVDRTEIRPRGSLVLRALLNTDHIVRLVDPDHVNKISISIGRRFPAPLRRKESPRTPRLTGGRSAVRDMKRFPIPDPRLRELVAACAVLES